MLEKWNMWYYVIWLLCFQAYTLIQQLDTANKEKLRKRKEISRAKKKAKLAQDEKKKENRLQKQKEERKKIFRMMGLAEKRKHNSKR